MCITHVYEQKEENAGVALGKYWAIGGTDLFFADSLYTFQVLYQMYALLYTNTTRHCLD